MPLSFRAIPPKILFHNANQFAGGQYRAIVPARALRSHGYAVTQSIMQMLEDRHLHVLSPDAVVFQHMHTEVQAEAIKRYRKLLKNSALIYEIDDVFWEVPDSSVHKSSIPADIKQQMAKAMRPCDAITVTTKPLADLISKVTPIKDIRILPNQLPKSFINGAIAASRTRESTEGRKIRIGWAGGIGHTGDLALITEVIREIGDEVTWVFMGMSPPDIDRADIEYHDPVPFNDYPAALGALHLDIALAPLEHNIFNRCKSDLRVLEYGAAGFAVIASDIQPYELCPVRKVRNVPDTWVSAIRELIADPDQRYGEAETLHQWVVHSRCMEDHLYAYERAYLHRGAQAFMPSIAKPTGLLLTVGDRVDGLDGYQTAAEAWAEAPGSDLLYIRPGTAVSPAQAGRLHNRLGYHASVTPLSNDGVMPRKGQFAPLTEITADRLDDAASMADCGTVEQPYASGPCVLLSAAAIDRHGLPDETRFASIEGALMDWSARTGEDGKSHAVSTDVFVAASQPTQLSQEYAQAVTEHTAAWTPAFLTALSRSTVADPLAGVREDIDLIYHRFNYTAPIPDQTYSDWARVFDEISEADCAAIEADTATWEQAPTIDIIMPVFNPNPTFLAVAIESVMRQTYPNWHLCIADDASTDAVVRAVLKNYAEKDSRITLTWRETNGHICAASNTALESANGEWLCFLDHDDVLPPHALYMIARESILHPQAKFIYSDSDKIDPNGNRCDPYFASDFNYELLLAQNYVCHLCAYQTDAVRDLGGLRPGYEGSQDWDLSLRYIDQECGNPPDRSLIRHIPHVLYHWRMSEDSTARNIMAKPYALEAGRNAVLEHIKRTNQNAVIAPHPLIPIFNMVRFLVPEDEPLVSIIIPTKDNPDVLQRCIGSLTQRTIYKNYEILVVDNGSKTKEAISVLNELRKMPKVWLLRDGKPFNYARINNEAVKRCAGEFVCLLNDDTEIVEGAWLHDMVGAAGRTGVGAVGPKLIYPDRSVQQCGTIFDPHAPPLMSALHCFQRLPVTHPGHMGRALLAAEFLAVTGACLLIRKDRYQAIGGLSEDFPYDYNDVDFCLRLHAAGYRNLVLGHVIICHLEGHTKRQFMDENTWKRVKADEDRLRARWSDIIDPYTNKNLAHTPNLDSLQHPAPAKPWDDGQYERVLIINGKKEDAIEAHHRKQIAYCGTLDGHFFRLTYPAIVNASALDLRHSPEAFVTMLGKLGIPRVMFCGIGDGTLGAVGFLTALADLGWPVEFTPNNAARGENPNDYIDPQGWRRTWDALLTRTSTATGEGPADIKPSEIRTPYPNAAE